MSLYSEVIKDSDYSNKIHIKYLMKLLRYKKLGVNQENVIREVVKVKRTYLTEKKDVLFYEKFYKQLDSVVTDKALKTKIKKYYLTSLGNYHYNYLRYDVANQNYLKTINLGNPSTQVVDLYIGSLMLSVDKLSDKQKALNRLNLAEKEYSKIRERKVYINYRAGLLTWLMIHNFKENKEGKAENNRKELEAIFANNTIKVNENNVGLAYLHAGTYFIEVAIGLSQKAI